jgi:hypothetical protein
MIRSRLYLLGFAAVLMLAAAITAYNLNGALTLESIPPGRMSFLSFTGLYDLLRGQVSSEAVKPQSILAYLLLSAGLGQSSSIEAATLAFFASTPILVGIFARLSAKSLLVAGASAL